MVVRNKHQNVKLKYKNIDKNKNIDRIVYNTILKLIKTRTKTYGGWQQVGVITDNGCNNSNSLYYKTIET